MLNIGTLLKNFFLPYPDHTIIIAYSGGGDSQVLLHALAHLKQQHSLPNTIHVCHVDHGLSPNAAAWQHFAKAQCENFNLPLSICEVNVLTKAQHSLESLARDARYQALREVCNEQKCPCLVVTGHHSDDQAETFLLALKRGAGLKGLSAMSRTIAFTGTNDKNCLLVRPLLDIKRSDIIAYAEQNKLDWIDDESNSDERFDRNFIRHQIMPLLTQRWPSMLSTMSRSAQHCQSAQTLLDELAEQDLQQCHEILNTGEQGLQADALKVLSIARFNNLIRYFLALAEKNMPSAEQLTQLHQQLSAADDKTPMVKLGDCWLRRFQQVWYLTKDFADVAQWQRNIPFHQLSTFELQLPDGLPVIAFSINQQQDEADNTIKVKQPSKNQCISVRFTHQNPRCLPDYRDHSRPLKKILQELAVAPWQRKRIAFLYYDNELVAALGHFICQPFIPEEMSSALSIEVKP